MEYFGIFSNRVVVDTELQPIMAVIIIKDGVIKHIDRIALEQAKEKYEWHIEDLSELVISPGVVDINVCFNSDNPTINMADAPTPESGCGIVSRQQIWEGYGYGTKAAISGGVTTILESPTLRYSSLNNSDSIKTKIQRMEQEALYCDIGLLGQATPENVGEVGEMSELGVFGFKGYLIPPGNEEFEYFKNEKQLKKCMKAIKKSESLLIMHPERATERMMFLSSPFRNVQVEDRPTIVSPTDLDVYAGALGDSPTSSKSSMSFGASPSPYKATPESNRSLSSCNSPPMFKRSPEQNEQNMAIFSHKIRKFNTNIDNLVSAELASYQSSGATMFEQNTTTPDKKPLTICTQLNRASTYSQNQIINLTQVPDEDESPELCRTLSINSTTVRRRPTPIICKPTPEKEEISWQRRDYSSQLANMPSKWEVNGVIMITEAMQKVPCRTHITNISSASATYESVTARKDLPQLSFDTAAAYLHFSDEHVKTGDTRFKTNPPIREFRNQKLLDEMLLMGSLDSITSYHRGIKASLKCIDKGDFKRAINGIASIGYSLPILWTKLKAYGEKSLNKLAQLLSERPATIMGLNAYKGSLSVGKHADIVVWDPDQQTNTSNLPFIYPEISIMMGQELYGHVHRTYLRGQLAYCEGQVIPATGRLLKK